VPIDIDPEAEEMFDEKRIRQSGDSVVITLNPRIMETAGFELGEEIRVTTPFGGGHITLEPTDHDTEDAELPAEA